VESSREQGIDLRVPKNAGKFLSRCTTEGPSSRVHLHGASTERNDVFTLATMNGAVFRLLIQSQSWVFASCCVCEIQVMGDLFRLRNVTIVDYFYYLLLLKLLHVSVVRPSSDRNIFIQYSSVKTRAVTVAANFRTSIFRDKTPCRPLKVSRRFGGSYRLHNQCYFSRRCRPIFFHARILLGLFLNPDDGSGDSPERRMT
jgi:hypothetical protein